MARIRPDLIDKVLAGGSPSTLTKREAPMTEPPEVPKDE
jgi:hypothetical protein